MDSTKIIILLLMRDNKDLFAIQYLYEDWHSVFRALVEEGLIQDYKITDKGTALANRLIDVFKQH